jgi:hypothetical protein
MIERFFPGALGVDDFMCRLEVALGGFGECIACDCNCASLAPGCGIVMRGASQYFKSQATNESKPTWYNKQNRVPS